MKRVARFLRWLSASLLALAQRCDPIAVNTFAVPVDDLLARAKDLVLQAESKAAEGTTGIYKRTVMVEPQLMAEFKTRSHRDICRAIEAAVSLKA